MARFSSVQASARAHPEMLYASAFKSPAHTRGNSRAKSLAVVNSTVSSRVHVIFGEIFASRGPVTNMSCLIIFTSPKFTRTREETAELTPNGLASFFAQLFPLVRAGFNFLARVHSRSQSSPLLRMRACSTPSGYAGSGVKNGARAHMLVCRGISFGLAHAHLLNIIRRNVGGEEQFNQTISRSANEMDGAFHVTCEIKFVFVSSFLLKPSSQDPQEFARVNLGHN